jgi:hypothetical protein
MVGPQDSAIYQRDDLGQVLGEKGSVGQVDSEPQAIRLCIVGIGGLTGILQNHGGNPSIEVKAYNPSRELIRLPTRG